MKIQSKAVFYADETISDGIVIFTGDGAVYGDEDGVEVIRAIDFTDVTDVSKAQDADGKYSLVLGFSDKKHEIRLADVENQPTWEDDAAGIQVAMHDVLSWKKKSSGVTSGAIDVTYAELVAKIESETLTPGTSYRITDFRTIHYFLDGEETIDETNEGATEVLIVKAATASTLEIEAISESHPDDLIFYDWNPLNWRSDKAYALNITTQEDTLVYGDIVPGWRGVIYFRHDTKQNNKMWYDFRAVKYRRWKLTADNYSAAATYGRGDWVNGEDGYLYRSAHNANTGNALNSAHWLQVIDLSVTSYWSWNSSGINGCPVNAIDYEDVYTFNLYRAVAGMNMGRKMPYYDDPSIISSLPNIVFVGLNNNDGNYNEDGYYWCLNNRFDGGAYFGNCTIIGNDFNSNTIGNYFNSNTIGNYFNSNTIGNGFNLNTIGNYFNLNTVGNYFSSNTVGNYFNSNTVGNNFSSNTVGNNFSSNTVGNYFSSNTVENGFDLIEFGEKIQATTFSTPKADGTKYMINDAGVCKALVLTGVLLTIESV